MTEILHHLSTCHSTLSLGVRGYKLCISKPKFIEVVQDFFHPPKKDKDFLYFKFLPVTSYFQGIKSIVRSSYSSPSVLHYSPAHSWARDKMSYMAAAARYTANCTQHSRYTTRNTTRYTTRNTTKMLSGAAFQVRTEKKLTCIFISFLSISGQDRKWSWLVFSFHSLKASKPLPAMPPLCCSAV